MSSLLTGVDIGAANVKILELKEKKDGFVLKNIMIAATPAKSVVEGAVLDHGAVAKVISDTAASVKGLGMEAALGLHGRDVVVKRVKLPWNGKGSFQENFIWSAEQYIGLSAEKASFDAQLLKYDIEKQVADSVLAAASKDKVADILTAANQAGMQPVVVDIEALALVNLITAMKGKQNHVNAIIDMGHDSVRIIFYEDGFVDMVTILHKGGKFLAEDLAQDMDIPQEKAEEMIRNKKTMSSDADAQATAMGYGSNIGSEIETSVDVYIQERDKEPVDFYVCGAGAYIPEVLEQIEVSMGVSIKPVDPFASFLEVPANLLPVIESAGPAAFAVAAGLAMRRG